MHDPQIEHMAAKIRSSGRRRRPNGRWSNPATPLQAARFELRKSGKEVVTAIRAICPGHAPGQACRIDVAKLSDYETGNRRPGLEHIEAFCRFYQRSPEALGLIKWRDDPTSESDNEAGQDDHATQDQLVRDWLYDSVTAIAAAVLQSLTRCPIRLNHQDGKQDAEPLS